MQSHPTSSGGTVIMSQYESLRTSSTHGHFSIASCAVLMHAYSKQTIRRPLLTISPIFGGAKI